MDVIVLGTGGNAVVVDPADVDQLRFEGAQLTAGFTVTSGGAAGDSVHLITESADGFIVCDVDGNWTAET